MLARYQLRQVARLLPVAAPAPDLVDAQVGMRAVAEADRGRRADYLLHRHHVFEVAEPEAAILLLDGDAVQPERAHLGPERAGKTVARVDLRGQRRDAVRGEARRRVADRVRGLAQRELKPATHRAFPWPNIRHMQPCIIRDPGTAARAARAAASAPGRTAPHRSRRRCGGRTTTTRSSSSARRPVRPPPSGAPRACWGR